MKTGSKFLPQRWHAHFKGLYLKEKVTKVDQVGSITIACIIFFVYLFSSNIQFTALRKETVLGVDKSRNNAEFNVL